MKQKLTMFMFLLILLGTFTVSLFGQTTWNVPGDKATLAAAITDLNALGTVGTSYVINLLAGNPQTAPAGGYTITANGTAANTITIKGNGNTITAYTPQTSGLLHDAIFEIVGGDYITIQDFVMQENAANTTTAAGTNNMTEWGVAILYASATNNSQYITVKNNTISLNRTYQNTFGIYANATHTTSSVSTSATATGASGGNHGLTIIGNNISNINNGITVVGPTAAADHNDGITIGGTLANANTITNFGTTGTFSSYANVSGSVNGILARNTKNYTISYNSITSSVGGTTAGTLRGIYIPGASNAVTGSPTNSINNNSISLKSAVASGAMYPIFTEGNATTSTTTLNINNNDFNNTTHTVAASGTIYCIYNTGTPLYFNINGNTFTNLSVNTTGSFAFIYSNVTLPATAVQNINSNSIVTAFNKTGAGGTVYLLNSFSSSPAGVTQNNMNNNFSNITLTGATTMAGWQNADGGAPTKTITGNVFNNWTCGSNAVTVLNVGYFGGNSSVSGNTITNITGTSSITALITGSSGAATLLNIDNNTINNVTSTGTGGSVIGISNSSPATLSTVYNNIIHTMSSSNTTAFVTGITSGASTSNISKNTIYNLSVSAAGGICQGIVISGGTTNNVFNNMVYGLQAPGSATSASVPSIQGVRIGGGTTVNVHYNSCLLDYSGANAYFSTAGLYLAGGTTNNIRNNIFVNKCAPGGSGRSVAIWKTTTGNTNFGASSDKNIYYYGSGAMAYNGTTTYATLGDWKAAMADRDLGSYEEDVPWISSTRTVNLHIDNSVPTRVEGNGVPIVSLCDVDYDGDDRNDSTPDIGADEGDFTAVQAPPGEPVYSSPTDTATNVAVNAPLMWSANSEGGTPTSYEVYFGLSESPDYLETVTVPTSNPAKEFGATYYWMIKAFNEQGQSEGRVWSFTVADGVPLLTSPGIDATGVSANPTFTWGAVAGATYKIKCGTSSGATDIIDMVACATNSYTPVTPLPYSTPLYWSVYSVNGAQEVQSLERSFTTMADPNNHVYPYAMNFEEITVAGNLPQYWSKTGTRWSSMTTTPSSSGYNRAPRSGTDYLTCQYSSGVSDWLFSRGMVLDASKTYDIGMWYNTDGLTGWTSVKMYIGTLATGASMTTELASVLAPVNMTYAQLSKTAWQPPTSGVYYVGFQVIATSSPWYLSFDDFTFAETPVNPLFAINPTSKAFGLKGVFTQTDQLFTISNEGQGTLTISAIEREGDACFSIVGAPELPIDLTPASPSTTFTVRYNPTVAGDFTGNIVITDNLSEKATRNVALTASAFDPILPITYTQNFSAGTSLPTYWTQSTSTWTIGSTHGRTNNGIYKNVYTAGTVGWFQTQPIGPITGSTRLSFYYRLMNYTSYPTGGAFTPGENDKIKVWVSTDEGTTFTQYGEINSTNHTVTTDWTEKQIWLSGAKASNGDRVVLKFEATWGSGDWFIDIDDIVVEHVNPDPTFGMTPTTKAFADTQINTSTAAQTFTISNIGGGSLTISEVGLAGDNADQFILTNGNLIPKVLAMGQSMNVTVAFKPTSIGAKTASLKVVDNLAKVTHYATLTGTGIDQTIYNLPYLQTLSEVPQAQYWQQFIIGSGATNRWSIANTNLACGLSPEWKCTYASGNPATTRLVSPPISVSGLSELVVKYRQTIDDYSEGCTYKLRYGYSVDSFFDIWSQASAGNTTYPAEEKVFTLTTQLVGHDIIYICWEIDGNFVGFDNWYIDNIKFLPTNTEVNQVVASGATAEVTIPAITVAGAPVSPQVGFTGLSGNPIINVWATYQPEGSALSTGMVLNVTGGNFSGVTMNITHNLGFIPQWIKYQVGGGEVIVVMSNPTWTTTTASITIDGAGKGPNDIIMLFPKDGDEPLAVNLSSFTAVLSADMFVKIAWIAESETSHSGYNVLRATEKDIQTATYLNSSLIAGGTLLGSQISYSYTDTETTSNTTYYYWLESVSLEGSSEFFGPLTVTIGDEPNDPTPTIPMFTELLNAYPNPFNPSTSIRYTMKEAGKVQIDIFNLKGQLVRRMNADHTAPGYFNMIWDGCDASGKSVGSGIYMYRMTSGKYNSAKKMILSK